MKLTEEMKAKIDIMSLREMLAKQRFASIGDPLFQGDIGEYFLKVMREKKSAISNDEWSNISRSVGW